MAGVRVIFYYYFFFFGGGGGGAFCFHFVLLFPYFWSVLNETIIMKLCYYRGGKFLKKLWCCVGGSITR